MEHPQTLLIMNELFPPCEVCVPSPRLLWIRKQGVKVFKSFGLEATDEPWNCYAELGEDEASTGITEDDAIAAWARKNNVRLWFEQL